MKPMKVGRKASCSRTRIQAAEIVAENPCCKIWVDSWRQGAGFIHAVAGELHAAASDFGKEKEAFSGDD